jgi:mRNA-degrading endonuclease RelE of RelBE toxin-antitoxin system
VRYRLEYSEDVRRAIRTLPGFYRQQVKRIVAGLADDPFPASAEALRDPIPSGYKIPVSGWRIIYQVDEADLCVYVLDIRRKTGPETYERLNLVLHEGESHYQAELS